MMDEKNYRKPGKYVAVCNKTNFDGYYCKVFDFPENAENYNGEKIDNAIQYFLFIDIIACVDKIYPIEIFANVLCNKVRMSGVLTKCEAHHEKIGTKWFFFIDCEMRSDDGSLVQFQTPNSIMNVSMCSGVPVVTFEEVEWLEETLSYVFQRNHSWFYLDNDNQLLPKINVSDRIHIEGQLKEGKSYKTLQDVVRIV